MFTIPNLADATYEPQAQPDAVDFDILQAGVTGDGVIDGCLVRESASPAMNVRIEDGDVQIADVIIPVTAQTKTIGTAHPSYARFDLVSVDDA